MGGGIFCSFLAAELTEGNSANGADQKSSAGNVHLNGGDMLTLRIVRTADGAFTSRSDSTVTLFYRIPLMVGLLGTAVDTYRNAPCLGNKLMSDYLLAAVGAYVLTVPSGRKGVLHFL